MKQVYILLFLFGLSAFAFGQEPTMTPDSLQILSDEPEAYFPGEFDALRKFLFQNVQITEEMYAYAKDGMHNKIIVRFVVNEEGNIEDAQIEKAGAYCPPCNKEALRVVKSMPKWHPALRDGKPTATFVRLPIIFSIQ
jgi:protein TonB